MLYDVSGMFDVVKSVGALAIIIGILVIGFRHTSSKKDGTDNSNTDTK